MSTKTALRNELRREISFFPETDDISLAHKAETTEHATAFNPLPIWQAMRGRFEFDAFVADLADIYWFTVQAHLHRALDETDDSDLTTFDIDAIADRLFAATTHRPEEGLFRGLVDWVSLIGNYIGSAGEGLNADFIEIHDAAVALNEHEDTLMDRHRTTGEIAPGIRLLHQRYCDLYLVPVKNGVVSPFGIENIPLSGARSNDDSKGRNR